MQESDWVAIIDCVIVEGFSEDMSVKLKFEWEEGTCHVNIREECSRKREELVQ